MSAEKIDTLVVGAGQAGIAMSEHLTNNGVPHVVLERKRIAERWRSERWDSLVANGPAWHDRFPNMEFKCDPDAFPGKESVADYFVAYAEMVKAPVRTGIEVKQARRTKGGSGFDVETSDGLIQAERIVAATGPFQKPIFPQIVPSDAGVSQIHSNDYHNPAQLPEGAVLVIGSGASGVQIADELQRSGRTVYLSVGPHHRPPRSYRGRDYCWWLGVLGKWDIQAVEPGLEHIAISVSGAYGGYSVDFRRLASQGITLVGMTDTYQDGILHFAPDLAENIAQGDANYLSVLQEADAFAKRHGLDLPDESEAHVLDPDPECLTNPIPELNLAKAKVSAIVWATGYTVDYSWLQVDTFDNNGRPRHTRGVSEEPGIYFLGLPWLSRRGSSFIWGVWHDARFIADQIAIQRNYLDYHNQVQARSQATASG